MGSLTFIRVVHYAVLVVAVAGAALSLFVERDGAQAAWQLIAAAWVVASLLRVPRPSRATGRFRVGPDPAPEAMQVERVHTAYGSHVEPQLDPGWDDFDKLRWHAAVASADTGLHVWVADHRGGEPSNDYSVQVNTARRATSSSAGDFNVAWTLISGISLGADAAGRERGGVPPLDAT